MVVTRQRDAFRNSSDERSNGLQRFAALSGETKGRGANNIHSFPMLVMYFSARRPRNVAIFSYKSAGKTDFATTSSCVNSR